MKDSRRAKQDSELFLTQKIDTSKDAVFTFSVFVAVCDIISHVGTNSLGRDVLAYCFGVRVHFLLQTTSSDLRMGTWSRKKKKH